jgi:hypothetical protein
MAVGCACSRIQPGNPVAGPYIVVSHRSADSDLARDIAEALKGRGHDVRGAEVGNNSQIKKSINIHAH